LKECISSGNCSHSWIGRKALDRKMIGINIRGCLAIIIWQRTLENGAKTDIKFIEKLIKLNCYTFMYH